MKPNFIRKNLNRSLNRTLGDRLQHYRKKKHISLEQAEEETKVRLKYLKALEQGNYEVLPADVYSLGFLTKYADFLGAPREKLLADFRREKEFGRPFEPIPTIRKYKEKIFITPKIIIIFGLILLGAGLIFYILYSIKNFTSPPNLEISSPVTETVIREDQVEVIGKTDQGCSLKINDQTILIDENGNFQEVLRLQPGINNIEIRSMNRLKKETVKVIKILAEF